MSKTSNILDELRIAIPALPSFSEKIEIPNPYSLADNDVNTVRNGYGIPVGPASPGFGEFKSFTQERDFTIILTRQVFATAHDQEPLVDATKLLLDDMFEVSKDVLSVDQLGIETQIEKVDQGTISGVEFIEADNFSLISMSASFIFTVREDL